MWALSVQDNRGEQTHEAGRRKGSLCLQIPLPSCSEELKYLEAGLH